MQLADRLSRIVEPQTIKMAKMSRELKAQGINIIDLSLGEPDFRTPEYICDAAVQAIQDGYTKYPPVAGFPDLRQAVCTKLKRDNDLDYLPENVIISTGAKQSLANAILSLVNPGDEVLIPTPYWVTYSALVNLAEGEPVYIPCSIDTDYKLTAQKLEAAITPKTRLFIYSSPCNPTGSVYSQNELEALAAIFERYPQVAIISDEIYEFINYTGKHCSLAHFPALRNRVVIVNGMSKGYAMTGWRLGYMIGPRELVTACEKLQSQFTSAANSITQKASVTALLGNQSASAAMRDSFMQRRDFVIVALKEIPGIKVNVPQGAFYAFPDISSFLGKQLHGITINNDEDFAMFLLNKANVATVCGSAFGNSNCIRISFAASMELLNDAMQRLKDTLC
jgi:aspartate aminotransferase